MRRGECLECAQQEDVLSTVQHMMQQRLPATDERQQGLVLQANVSRLEITAGRHSASKPSASLIHFAPVVPHVVLELALQGRVPPCGAQQRHAARDLRSSTRLVRRACRECTCRGLPLHNSQRRRISAAHKERHLQPVCRAPPGLAARVRSMGSPRLQKSPKVQLWHGTAATD